MRTFGRPRVLVCDDEEIVLRTCSMALRRAGYDTHEVEDGAAAVEAARRDCFDLLLLDVRLPGMDGPETLASIAREDPDLPCVIISGYSAFEDAIRCLQQGAVDFVRKPFDVELIVRTVDRALAKTHLKVDSALLAATRTIVTSLDVRQVATSVLSTLGTLLAAEDRGLLLGSSEPGRRFGTSAGKAPVPTPEQWRRLVEPRDPYVLVPESAGDAELQAVVAPGSGETLVNVLRVIDQVVGLAWASRAPGARRFGERDLRRSSLMAGHIALALENARHYQATLEQAAVIELAFERLMVAERMGSFARLASGLGHEIANPAYAVKANVEGATDLIAAGRLEEAAGALARARYGTDAVLDVCDTLRALASGSARPGGAADLRRVIDGAILLSSHRTRSRAHVLVDLPANVPSPQGGTAQLGQVLLNLLLNAAEAIQPGHPELNEIRIAVRADGGQVVVQVSDTGPGIPPDILPHIFQPDVTSRSNAEGHGMGLALCRWIVESVGGTIRCESDHARSGGTTFELRLPINAAP